jgi:hypothetical protein
MSKKYEECEHELDTIRRGGGLEALEGIVMGLVWFVVLYLLVEGF